MRVTRVIRVGVRVVAVGVHMSRAVRVRVAVVVDQPLHDNPTARQVPVPVVMPREVSERADDEQRRDQGSEGVGPPHAIRRGQARDLTGRRPGPNGSGREGWPALAFATAAESPSRSLPSPHNHPVSMSRTCRGAPAKPWITGSSLRGAPRSHTLAKRYSPSRQTASVTFSTVNSSATRGQR